MQKATSVASLPHDIREGKRWKPLQRVKNDAFYLLARGALSCANLFGARALTRFGRLLGACTLHMVRPVRRMAERNLARVLPGLAPKERAQLLAANARNLGENFAQMVATLLDKGGVHEALRVDDDGRKALLRLHEEGRGIVLASAHLGNWEAVGAALARTSLSIVAVVREAYDTRFDAWFLRMRERAGMDSIPRGSKGAAFRMVRALRQNKVLAIPMDLASRVPSIRVPFLGLDAPTAVGPARVGLRTGAAVVVATLAPGNVVTVTPIDTSDLTASPEGEAELTKRINDELSRRILALPEAWLWAHPRWDERKVTSAQKER